MTVPRLPATAGLAGRRAIVIAVAASLLVLLAGHPAAASHTTVPPITGPLHTTGSDSVVYDASNRPIRLVGFNWTGTEHGGRTDHLKLPDACGNVWRTPADRMAHQTVTYDDFYARLRNWGFNVIRLPVAWHNLEPTAPTWDAASNQYIRRWNTNYINDLKSIVSKARANNLGVILDMHQDYWSPSMHNFTYWDGRKGYCEGVGMPRWLNPSIDAKATTMQTTDFYNAMNWFYRNIHDPGATVTRLSPWQLFYSAWDQLAYQFSPASGFADSAAVIGADILNEPYWSYVGGSPPAGQTVRQAADVRLRAFYNAIAPAITTRRPNWLLFFQDSTGGWNSSDPSQRSSPILTNRPSAPGRWVYSTHLYNFSTGTFNSGVPAQDDYGITVANAWRDNARRWKVPLYIGEWISFTTGQDARTLTDADMGQTKQFLSWAKTNDVSQSFWAYVNPHRPMTAVEYTDNKPIAVVINALRTGL